MISVPLYNQEGKEVGKQEFPKKYFDVALNPALVTEVIVALLAGRRASSAHTKTRGEVRGGGKKPWKQKGTGRARHGSIRSPLWKGGGVTFGPRNVKNYEKHVNAKARRKALLMALTEKVRDKKLIVVETLNIEKPKTKALATLLSRLPKVRSYLLALDAHHQAVLRASRNMQHVDTTAVRNLNAHDVISHDGMILSKEAAAQLVTFVSGK